MSVKGESNPSDSILILIETFRSLPVKFYLFFYYLGPKLVSGKSRDHSLEGWGSRTYVRVSVRVCVRTLDLVLDHVCWYDEVHGLISKEVAV